MSDTPDSTQPVRDPKTPDPKTPATEPVRPTRSPERRPTDPGDAEQEDERRRR